MVDINVYEPWSYILDTINKYADKCIQVDHQKVFVLTHEAKKLSKSKFQAWRCYRATFSPDDYTVAVTSCTAIDLQ